MEDGRQAGQKYLQQLFRATHWEQETPADFFQTLSREPMHVRHGSILQHSEKHRSPVARDSEPTGEGGHLIHAQLLNSVLEYSF